MISCTPEAAAKISNQLKKRNKGIGIRLAVKTTGCSGLSYLLEFVDDLDINDYMFETNGAKLFVDPKSFIFVDGTIIDYEKQGLSDGFTFTNPLEKDKCGCGKSFKI